MTLTTSAPPPLLIALGIVVLAGAAGLAWFSALATLQLARVDATSTVVTIERRIVGLVSVSTERIDGVRKVSTVSNQLPDSSSRTTTATYRLVFATASGSIDLGHSQQLFLKQFPAIRDFFDDGSRRELTLYHADGFWEGLRFASAQAGVLFLTALGALLLLLGKRGLLPDPDAGIGPRH